MAIKLKKDAQASSKLPIIPTMNEEGIFIQEIPLTYLFDVRVDWTEHAKGEFKGIKVPSITFEFRNHKLSADEPDRYHFHSVNLPNRFQVTKGTEELEERPTDKVIKNIEDLWLQVKHIYEAYESCPGYTDIAKLSDEEIGEALSIEEAGDPQVRQDSFARFANWYVGLFNGRVKEGEQPKPIYIIDGQYLPAWLKLVPDFSQRKYYVLPTWVRHGIIELAKTDSKGNFIKSDKVYLEIDEDLKLVKPTPKGAANDDSITGAVDELPDYVKQAIKNNQSA